MLCRGHLSSFHSGTLTPIHGASDSTGEGIEREGEGQDTVCRDKEIDSEREGF